MKKIRQVFIAVLICSMVLGIGGAIDLHAGGASAYGESAAKKAASSGDIGAMKAAEDPDAKAGEAEETETPADEDAGKDSGDSDSSGGGSEKHDADDSGSNPKKETEKPQKAETEATTSAPVEETAATQAAEEDTIAYREVKAELVQEPLYQDHQQKQRTDAYQRLTRLWESLMKRDAVSEADDLQLKIVVSGELPEGITAEAKYITLEEGSVYTEKGLASLEIVLYDQDGNVYIPAEPVDVAIRGAILKNETRDDNALLIYAWQENAKRAEKYTKKYKKNIYAADVTVYRGDDADKDLLNYKVYKKNKKYKKGKDAVRYTEDEAGLFAEKNAVSFSYDYEGNKTGRMQLVLTAQMAERTLDARAVKGAGASSKAEDVSVTVRGALDREVSLEATEITRGRAYRNYVKQTAQALGVDEADLKFARAFDIKLLDPETGEAFEPDSEMKVNIELADEKINKKSNIDVVHFAESEDAKTAEPEVLESSVDGTNVAFETGGFSVYVVTDYILTAAQESESAQTEDDTKFLQKTFDGFTNNHAKYTIVVNPNSDSINGGAPYTITDEFNENQSINYGSISVDYAYQMGSVVTYDYSGRTGTFSIPDGTKVTIEYSTRVTGQAGDTRELTSKATFGDYSAETSDVVTIDPDIEGTGGVFSIDLFVYPENHMERGLSGAVFRLLDSNKKPMKYQAGDKKGEEITFETSDGSDADSQKGYVRIQLDKETQGVSIHKNTAYYLEMITAPYELEGGEYTYYKKDNTLYSFLITDNPSYTYGGVYSYFNGDVMKVRCYPEGGGVNVTKRFSGNYELTNEQKNQIVFTLQKEALDEQGGWIDVERHTYNDFNYGSITFKEGSNLDPGATYRVLETNGLPEGLEGKVEWNQSCSVSYQKDGIPEEKEGNEFEVDQDSRSHSYNLTFTNEYVDHKLTIIKLDENTGDTLSGAEFTVYRASDNAEIKKYQTNETITAQDGKESRAYVPISIRRNDEGANYEADTLYYAMETQAPQEYLLPSDPEKVYFYFSEKSQAVPSGLPSGSTATDLTKSYNTVTIADSSNTVDVPVTVTWGLKGDESWPDNVAKVKVGLYQSVNGSEPKPATDEGLFGFFERPVQVELTKEQYYSTEFKGLPAEDAHGNLITYSVKEEGVFDDQNNNIIDQYATSSSISGTGWYVINNQPGVSVRVIKKWEDLEGQAIENPSEKPNVTFDLYRTTKEPDTGNGSFTRAQLKEFLKNADKVRSDLTLSGSSDSPWTTTVNSLQEKNKKEETYYYYALEDLPDNQEDTYNVMEAAGTEPRTLTITNKQTPFTVTIGVKDAEKTYGEADPTYEFEADVKEPGATVTVSGPDESGNYTATVKAANDEQKQIGFSVSRDAGEDAGAYPITPSGDELQEGYRVLFESGTLTIKQAQVTITAGATKVYGDSDPALVSIEGLSSQEALSSLQYSVSREEGEDVGDYEIILTGEEDQGNYRVTYVRKDESGKPYTFTITRAPVEVKATDQNKSYGEDDPDFTANVNGLKQGDGESVITYEITRDPGESVGTYTIKPAGDAEQGNYSVTYVNGTLTIGTAELRIRVEDAEKTYGDVDPEWEASINGLQGSDEIGTLHSVLDEQTGERSYTYTVGKGEDTKELIRFSVSRTSGENVGEYNLTPAGETSQSNYSITFTSGKLTILPAELIVTPDHVVKAVGVEEDPLLTATVTGWKNGDENAERTSIIGEGANAGKVIWTYTRDEEPILTFTLQRDAGEEEGDYNITATGKSNQSNYSIEYETGIFGILSILDVDVTQPLVDHADADANPVYNYTATLDLTGTGLSEYNKNGFSEVDGVPTMTFTLPDPDDKVNMKTLKIPGGAKLTVTQNTTHDDYTTAVKLDGSPYTDPEGQLRCRIDGVYTYHEIAFAHSRISLPVSARAAVGQTEDGAAALEGRDGAMGIPRGDGNTRTIDADFADEMHSKIGYKLPTDKYYMYDHASLYTKAGAAIQEALGVTEIWYDLANSKWQYKTEGSSYSDVPDDSQLVLFYLPKSVCKIGNEKFYSLNAAVEYAEKKLNGKATIEMLIGEYSIRSDADKVMIGANDEITITTASTEYEGTGTAVISRSIGLTSGHLFTNKGSLTLDKIVIDGKDVKASDALILNETSGANLTVNSEAILRNADGNKGGAIYVKNGTVTVNGQLSDNNASMGGAVYVAAGDLTLGSSSVVSGNSADSGGAVYIENGTVTISTGEGMLGRGKISENRAGNGGVLYLAKGTVKVNGTIGVDDEAQENTARLGGAVYAAGGTLEISGTIQGSNATENGGAVCVMGGKVDITETGTLSGNRASSNGGAIFQSSGTLTSEGKISGNAAISGGGIYRVDGALTIGGEVSSNEASANGGGIYSIGGTVNVNAKMMENRATNGGAIFAGSATLNIQGGEIGAENAPNTASGNGGAIYALNTITVIGGKAANNNSAVAVKKASVSYNKADGSGGAVYMDGGSLTVLAASEMSSNKAADGGGVYATSGAITLTDGELSQNEANGSGGAIHAGSAAVTISAGSLLGNKANAGNGGAVFSDSGAVTISGGTLSGNSASSGEKTDISLGFGGAVYAGSGTVNYTGGNINGGNSAVNGSAIYIGTGIANISASITDNTATNGGAVGVGSTSARLNFSGNAEVNNNMMDGAQSNVYLDVDSELVINADNLNSGKTIGVYVPGEVTDEQVVKHGDVAGYFGAYVSVGNLSNLSSVFKNDRFTDLKVKYENNRLYWVHELKYDIYYLKSYDSQFPPTTVSPSKNVVSDKNYEPRSRECDIYDLVMAMKLYEAHDGDFKSKVGNNYASTAVYAYTYSDKNMNHFGDYLKSVRWDAADRNWKFIKQDGSEASVETSKLMIFYSAPAYLTIVNNNESGLELDISEISVLSNNAVDGLYGFVTAKNGATVQTLRTIGQDDLKLKAGDSIKLMFPGAQNQNFTFKGTFTGEGAVSDTSIGYTFNGSTYTTGIHVDLSDNTYKFHNNDEAAELIFGDNLPICKIGSEPFQTLKDAMKFAIDQKAATGNEKYQIEMLVDYLVPKGDVLEIPAGYDITFTTASRDAETLPYTGSGIRATLSRDTGNTGASVSASNSTLTVDNLAFDGRSLTAGGKGGAVSATNCATVTITNSAFTGYRADNGGAIYVENRNADSKLTVEGCDFSNCQTNASGDKAGGGGIWTTARELYVRKCTFDSCACLLGSAQAGSIFHNIQSGWSAKSKTVVEDCAFSNSFSVGGSGGTIESDALDVTISGSSFEGSYSNKSGGNGGAINIYADNADTTNNYCILRVNNCTFDNCRSKNGGARGGAIRTTSHDLILRGCIFRNTQSVTGGAVSMTNPKKLEIYGCTFDNCLATGNGGAVSSGAAEVIIGKDEPGNYLDKTTKDGYNHFVDCTANRGGGIDNVKDDAAVTMQNVNFTRCVARTGSGGALCTQAKTLAITGDSNTFTDCNGYGSGGAVYQNRNVDGSKVELENCKFTGCEAFNKGNGGGMYTNARTLNITGKNTGETTDDTIGERTGFFNCTAANSGGGLFHDYAGTVTIQNCGFDSCTALAGVGGGLRTSAHTVTITGKKSIFKNCTAQTNGGGLYGERNANGSSFEFRDGAFENCTAMGNEGGAIYSRAKWVTVADCSITGCTSKANGGGINIEPSTASFDGCTITGNSVTNSDSKGGGVYVNGGTTTFIDSNVSGCEAANGGGWYQNNGTLYILGGSISGKAVNGGGLYMANGTVNHYAGTVSGEATANGGGVYKNNGNYTLGNDTYNEEAYADGACIGGLITLTGTDDGEETTKTITSSAVNGGGVYNAGGTLYMKDGGSIGSTPANSEGETVYTATATANGGGIYLGGGAVRIYGGVITNCQATGNGGGIYHTSTGNSNDLFFYGTDDTAKIQNCRATNGGGVYVNSNTFHMGENGKTSLGTIENCHATSNGGGVYVANGTFNHRNTSSINECSADADGGAVYQSGGTFNLSGGSLNHSTASGNGGGVFHAGGAFTFSGGSIIRNSATGNGGGVYHAGGKFSMTDAGAVIGGAEPNGNTASIGAGVFVANGQSATFYDNKARTLKISHNHALTEGGGIAVGGPETVLTFQGTVTIRQNTMGSQDIECNVYLDQDSNSVIQNNALNAGSYIGVYASDAQDSGHGVPGQPFATWSDNNNGYKNLNVYRNDRRQYLYGVKGSGNLVIWSKFVCKITDGSGHLLYKDAEGTPAVYEELENKNANSDVTAGAFYALNSASPVFYIKDSEGNFIVYSEKDYQVEMLVQDYELASGRQIQLNVSGRKVTLTTASSEPDECGFMYSGDARFNATIKRTANTFSMIYVGGTNVWELTLRDITLDGNGYTATQNGAIVQIVNGSSVILENGSLLESGKASNGGAVYINHANSSVIMNAGSKIENCIATGNGGAICVDNGVFTINDGEIIRCNAANGGGVFAKSTGKVVMNGGWITENNATKQGGGIAIDGASASVVFSGYCTVLDNTLNESTRCNVQFNHDANSHIKANGMDGRSEIGIYTADDTIYKNHGKSGDPFGTWTESGDNLFCFVNDRSQEKEGKDLRGFQNADPGDQRIFWEYHPLLTVSKDVVSDWSYDKSNAEFAFEVQMPKERFGKAITYGDMNFDKDGKAIVKLKAGESATAILPDTFDKTDYEVAEILSNAQTGDYTTKAEKNGEAYVFKEANPLTVDGQLGENVGKTGKSTSLSTVAFTNTRNPGDLSISKTVVTETESDKEESFDFRLTLDDQTINKTYQTVSINGGNLTGDITFHDGVANFTLKHGQLIKIIGLPTELGYTVEECLTDVQKTHIRTQVAKGDAEPVYGTSQSGTIGENNASENGQKNQTLLNTVLNRLTYDHASADVVFTNNFLKIVCKITNRSRDLLYYRDAASNLQPAIYSHLEDAFAQVNIGNLRTSANGTVSGALRIEMVVPEYSMEKHANLDKGKTVILSTALTTDQEYPYNEGADDNDDRGNISVVSRGFAGDSMIVDMGALTLERIILDGASEADEPLKSDANGGIIQVAGAERLTLTVSNGAVLRNSDTEGSGGAVYLTSGASIVMNGTIQNCAAKQGGAIYADKGFASIASTSGIISGCDATGGNGGAICTGTGGSVSINAGTKIVGNSAQGSGGAIYSDASVILRGEIGGAQENQGNTATGDGGGVCIGEDGVFTMYSGSSIAGNRAANGGGLATRSGTTRIAGGTFEGNHADGRGGAVFDAGAVTMTGGSMKNNLAGEKGGAVYVVDQKSFAMTGGTIGESSDDQSDAAANKSPEGAVSTGTGSVLSFSGNAVVIGNTGTDGKTSMNVYLGYDSNSIIQTSGLGANANIGVYAADGDPEGEVDKPIYYRHGIAARNFGTYTGTSIRNARLDKFTNDRDSQLNGMPGAQIENENHYYVMWKGKDLTLRVMNYDTKDSEAPEALKDVQFTMATGNGTQIWSGRSDENGMVTVKWGAADGGNTAAFTPGSTYILKESATNEKTVLPAGTWKLMIGYDNSATWVANAFTKQEEADSPYINRILNVESASGVEGRTSYIGELFYLYNDRKPTITFDPNGGVLAGKEKTDHSPETGDVPFTVTQLNHDYTIGAVNPSWDSHVFMGWSTVKIDPTDKNPADTGDSYARGDRIKFYRGADEVEDKDKSTHNGDLTLYAVWKEVVCKITDRDGKLLYVDGSPAVYDTLEGGFSAYNSGTSKTFTYKNGSSATARMIKMLVGSYSLNNPVELSRGKTAALTTASISDNDGYAYTGQENSYSIIVRDGALTSEKIDKSMIRILGSLTLTNITLDGHAAGENGVTSSANGGIINVAQKSAALTIGTGTTLRNSSVSSRGGAVYAVSDAKITMKTGTIKGCSAADGGAGIYLEEGARLSLSGSPAFESNTTEMSGYTGKKNGGSFYDSDNVRQDIYIAGYYSDSDVNPKRATSLEVNGKITSDPGSIWVWAEETPHYETLQQFATITSAVSEADRESTCKAFRNARDDEATKNNTGAYLYGMVKESDGDNIYWYGVEGSRKVVLRKVNGSFSSLEGAEFMVTNSPGSNTPAKDVNGTNLEKLTSTASGVFYAGELNFGTYYVEETTPPQGYSKPDGKYFIITVNENGVGYSPDGGKTFTKEVKAVNN